MLYRVAFSLIRGMGVELAQRFLNVLPDEESFFSASRESLVEISGSQSKIFGSDYRNLILEKAQKEMEFIERNNIKVSYFSDADFPQRLLQCYDAPILLFSLGAADLNSRHVISVVGTRHATSYGVKFTEKMISDLAEALPDTVVVSGLAYGIDIAAHTAAVNNSLSTVAVLAHGLNTVYPAQHRNFASRMVGNNGMLLSDYTSQDAIHRANFLARNRIVAALSDCTVVIESADKGGAMVTASLAMGYNRDVFALPGRIGDKYSSGCNSLIRHNTASLFTDASQLIDAMRWEVEKKDRSVPKNATLFPDISREEEPVYCIIQSKSIVHVNEISNATQIPMPQLLDMLVDMEFRGTIRSLPGGYYSL